MSRRFATWEKVNVFRKRHFQSISERPLPRGRQVRYERIVTSGQSSSPKMLSLLELLLLEDSLLELLLLEDSLLLELLETGSSEFNARLPHLGQLRSPSELYAFISQHLGRFMSKQFPPPLLHCPSTQLKPFKQGPSQPVFNPGIGSV